MLATADRMESAQVHASMYDTETFYNECINLLN